MKLISYQWSPPQALMVSNATPQHSLGLVMSPETLTIVTAILAAISVGLALLSSKIDPPDPWDLGDY